MLSLLWHVCPGKTYDDEEVCVKKAMQMIIRLSNLDLPNDVLYLELVSVQLVVTSVLAARNKRLITNIIWICLN